MPRRIIKHAKDNPNTWKGIAFGAFVLAVIATTLATYHDHGLAPLEKPKKQKIITGKVLSLSDESRAEIQRFVKREALVVAVAAVRASLSKNERYTEYFFADDAGLQAVWDEYLTRRIAAPLPVFASAPSNNDRMANVLNGAFDCRPFKDTVSYQLFPAADKYAPWLCTVSVPPGFDGSGDFTGFLTFYLKKEPTEGDKKSLAVIASELAAAIYRRDVENTTAK